MRSKLIGIFLCIILVIGGLFIFTGNKEISDVDLSARLTAYIVVTARTSADKILGESEDMDSMTTTRNGSKLLQDTLENCSEEAKPRVEALLDANSAIIKNEKGSSDIYANAVNDVSNLLSQISIENDLKNESNKKSYDKKVDKYVSEITK